MRGLIRLAGMAALCACAQQQAPPGGPEDLEPPRLLAVSPDSGAVNVRPDRVLFQFDEVLAERPRGVRALEDLFIVSPHTGELRVEWRRRVLALRPPRGGWRPNTAYTVTMLPGVVDLRGNVLTSGATTVFSTGAVIPESEITGVVFDWAAGRAIPNAMVEAVLRPDSVVFVARADSTGRFTVRNLAPGTYTVIGWQDVTANRQRDVREPWDSVSLGLTTRDSVALHAFVQDTIGPGIAELRVVDSLHLRLTFDRPVDVGQELTPALFRLLDADSVAIPVMETLAASAWDERERARVDTAPRAAQRPAVPVPAPARPRAGAPDPLRPDTGALARPEMQRPRPVTTFVLTLARPLRPETSYRLRAEGIRNLGGWPRDSERVFQTPARPAAQAGLPDEQPPASPPGERH